MARGLRVGRWRRPQALVVDPRPLRGLGPSPTKPRRSLHGPSVRRGRSSVGRRRGSQPCAPIPEQKTLGAPRRARDPRPPWVTCGVPETCVSAAGGDGKLSLSIPVRCADRAPRQRSRAAASLVLGGCARSACRPLAGIASARRRSPAMGRGPSPTQRPRGLLGPSVRCDRSSVGRWRGSQPCAPIPEQKTLGAPRRARDPAASLGDLWSVERPACRPPAATASSRCRSPSAARTGPLANEAAPRPLWMLGAMREICVSAAGGDRKRASSIPGHGPGPLADAATPRPPWTLGATRETCVSAAGGDGKLSLSIPVRCADRAPRQRSRAATTSTPPRRRRERRRSAGRAGDPTRGTARCP